MSKITVSIIGATGYTGIELLKLLINHPNVEIKHLTSNSHRGKISDLYGHFKQVCDLQLSNIEPIKVAKDSDITFLALPHKETQKIVPQIIEHTKIIDLSGDFRIQDEELYQKYYHQKHSCPELVYKFTYGLPELYKDQIEKAQHIANPGCFATVAQLALFPLKGSIENVKMIALTGSSGSGKIASEATHHPIRNHNVKSYKIDGHQHIPEIIQSLEIENSALSFVPTSAPFTRGIHLTAFVKTDQKNTKDLYEKAYADCPFIRIVDQVELANVVGSNFCDIAIHEQDGEIIIQAAIDNLLKGAAGTAMQNFNLMNNLEENTGLKHLTPLYP